MGEDGRRSRAGSHPVWLGYDRASNRTWRNNLAATAGEEAEHCAYDGLYRVTGRARGNLNLNQTAIAAIPKAGEQFPYDPTGNWLRFRPHFIPA